MAEVEKKEMIFPAVLNPIDSGLLIVGLIIALLAIALTIILFWFFGDKSNG
jgi:hypothetical protein